MKELNSQERIIIDYIDSHHTEMLELWEKLVSTESPTANKEAVDKVGQILRNELELSGAKVQFEKVDTRGDVLYAVWGEDNPKKPIILCGHMDTVFPIGTLKEHPFCIENGKAYGPGILDMKAGLVIAVFVIRALSSALYQDRPIHVIFPGDEEGGHRQSNVKEIIPKLACGAGAAFNFETGFIDDGIVVSRKGSCRFSLDVTGVAAHAGNCPEKGRNAIEEMSHKVLALQSLNDLEHGTSVNVGIITGGTVVNAIPGSCHVDVDVRYTKRELLDALLNKVNEIVNTNYVDGCSCTLTMQPISMVMERTESTMKLFHHVQETAKRIGYGDIKPIGSGGWSDSNILSSLGIPVICAMGVKGENNHTLEEYAIVDSLFERAKLAAISILRLSEEII